MILEELLKNPETEVLFEELEKNKKNEEICRNIISEINNRLANNDFTFTNKYIKYLYVYMFLCNKYEFVDTLNSLIEDEKFVELLDKTNIEGSMIPSLTMNCNKPRRLIMSHSLKIKNSVLNGDNLLSSTDILEDLTKEEIKILRKDIQIDNFLINKGLCFDTLKKETINQLLEEIDTFSLYSIKTISEFSNSYKDIKSLAQNKEFVKIYISKLTNEYNYKNNIFKYMDKTQIDKLVTDRQRECVLFHLVKDTTGTIQKEILKNKRVKKLLRDCDNNFILEQLPSNTILNILLNKKDNITVNNLKLLNYLNKQDIETIFTKRENIYDLFVNELEKETNLNLSLIINSLPLELFKDLSEERIYNFKISTINKLLESSKKSFKKSILKNSKLITQLANSVNMKNYKKIIELFNAGDFTPEEKIKFITKIENISNKKVLVRLIESVPTNYRKVFCDDLEIRTIILNDESYELDEYLKNYLLNNPEELENIDSRIIVTMLKESDNDYIKKAISNKVIIKKILYSKNPKIITDLINIVKESKQFLSIINSENMLGIYNIDLLQAILANLDITEKNVLCSDELMHKILNEEAYATYTKLLNKNGYILNTLNLNYLQENIFVPKLSIQETITKNPRLQDLLMRINKIFPITKQLINVIFYEMSDIDLNLNIVECLHLLCESCEGNKRKYVGNIPKLLSVVSENEISNEDIKNILNYLMYLIPRYTKNNKDVKRPIYLNTARTYNEIKYYEKNTEEELNRLMFDCKKDNKYKEYFIAKHFKLTLDEAELQLNTYKIDKVDKKIYKEEYEYITNLNKIMNSEVSVLKNLEKNYKILSIYDSFRIENKLKQMYSKIYNYEIKCKIYTSKSFVENDLCKNLKIYNCPNEFMFLISCLDFENELGNKKDYFLAWHNTLNKTKDGVPTSLISNENLHFEKDFYFGFDGVAENGIKKMSNKVLSLSDDNKHNEMFITPKNLIDNTRDIRNTIIIDKYAIRPNYNNSNIPNIEPDFMIVDKTKLDDSSYVEKVVNISEAFKTKRNKKGLPIIAIDKEKVVGNEVKKINYLFEKFRKTHDISTLKTLLTRSENNYCAFYNSNISTLFDVENIVNLVREIIKTTESINELKSIEKIFTDESNKFKSVNEIPCNFNINKK